MGGTEPLAVKPGEISKGQEVEILGCQTKTPGAVEGISTLQLHLNWT